jgi:polyisoprenoid-binding protein YceI
MGLIGYGVVALLFLSAAPAEDAGAGVGPAVGLAADTARVWVVAPAGNVARYRVREQLAGFDLPNDAVGTTTAIQGRVTLAEDGALVPGSSRFVIELATLETDQGMRDNYVRRRTLRTDSFPAAVFVPTGVRGAAVPPADGEVTFQLVGELTLVGETRVVVWDVTARLEGGAVVGTATTRFRFDEFGIPVPSVRRVLSVDDDIRLEYDFRLVPADG